MGGHVRLELLQGTLDMLILKALTWGPDHGYGIARWIQERTGDSLAVEEGSLYPALHRMTRRGWLAAQWGVSANNRRARYYRLTAAGRHQLGQEAKSWREFTRVVDLVMTARPRGLGGTVSWRPDRYQGLSDDLARDADPEVREELAAHLALRIEEHRAAGMSPAEAEALARRQFGDLDRYWRETRRVEQAARTSLRRRERLALVWQEIRRAVRSLARAPTFSMAAVVTLALGIGAGTAIFAILDAVVLRPLPYPDADRLVRIYHPVPRNGPGERWNISTAEYFHFATEAKAIDRIGLFGASTFTVMADGQAHQVRGAMVTASTLGLLGARAVHGRLFTEADEIRDAPVLVSESFWRSRLGAAPSAVGSTIRIEGGDAVIAGVVGDGARLPGWVPDLWIPFGLDPKAPARNFHTFKAVARLAPGATVAAASAELAAMVPRYPERFPTAYDQKFLDRTGFTTMVLPWKDDVTGDSTRVLWLLFGAVGVVLLIICFNVGNLFVVRSQTMRREAAVRAALGAGRGRLLWHHLAESSVVTAVALGLGLALAWAGLAVFRSVVGAGDAGGPIPRLDELALGGRAIGSAVAIAALVAMMMALGPVALGPRPAAILRQGGRGLTASRRDAVIRATLVVGQITLAVVLLAAAALMARTFRNLRQVEPGFDPKGLAVVDVALPYGRYQSYPLTTAFYRRLVEAVERIPAVRRAAVASEVPIEAGDGCSIFEYPDRSEQTDVSCIGSAVVGPGYFATLGVELEGRDLEWQDLDAKTGGVVLTDVLVRRLWPGRSGVDRPVNGPNGKKDPPYRVAGVSHRLKWRGLDLEAPEVAFFPLEPIPGTWLWAPPARMVLVARLVGAEPAAVLPEIRRIAAAIDPEAAVTNPRSMTEVMATSLLRVRLLMGLLGFAALVSLLLSVVGLYGVVAHLVTRRTQEIGVRIALGAPAGGVRALVVGESVRLALIGVGLGLAGALVLTRSMRSLLFGVSSADPVSLGAAASVLLVVALVASLGPAYRATRIDPIEALRAE